MYKYVDKRAMLNIMKPRTFRDTLALGSYYNTAVFPWNRSSFSDEPLKGIATNRLFSKLADESERNWLYSGEKREFAIKEDPVHLLLSSFITNS